jgi:hypothetical protein
MVLGPLVSGLLETEDAMKKVEMASNGLSDAQNVLGQMFDLTTGKLKSQNDMLKLNAELMAINLRAQAQSEKPMPSPPWTDLGKVALVFRPGKRHWAHWYQCRRRDGARSQVRQLVEDMRAGRVSGVAAARRAEGLDFSGLAVTKEDFLRAVADGVSYPEKQKVADAIEKSLKEGVLDPSLRQAGSAQSKKARKSRSGKTEEDIDAEFLKDMDAIDSQELAARQALATSAQERADIAYQMLGDQRDQREAEIRANKDYSEAQKKQLIAALDGLYGQRSNDGTILVGKAGLLQTQIGRQQQQAEAQLANDMLARQATTLEAWAQVSTTAKNAPASKPKRSKSSNRSRAICWSSKSRAAKSLMRPRHARS